MAKVKNGGNGQFFFSPCSTEHRDEDALEYDVLTLVL
jgi:hypothetical protein